MKAVLMSIQPKWCEKIASGKKTIEVRKSRPKLETPFKVYIYATWNGSKKEILVKQDGLLFCEDWRKASGLQRASGKVIGEFVCDSVEMVNAGCSDYGIDLFYHDCMTKGCLTESEVDKYFNIPEDKDLRAMKGNGYAWHISQLKIYDKPKELSEFYIFDGNKRRPLVECEHKKRGYSHDWCLQMDGHFCCECLCDKKRITRPPQSWCYVEVKE